MANKKIQATATLFLDFKNAKSDFTEFFNYVMQGLNSIETASDKMTVFKDMVSYIAQVDRALSTLKAKNGDAFNSMFDGLDANLRKQFEDLFGVDGGQLGQLDVLREKLASLTPKSSMGEFRELAGAIKDLYASVGKDAPNLDFLDGSSQKAKTTYIQQLTDAVGDFATVWKDVNTRVSQGLGGGNAVNSDGFGENFTPSKQAQEEIDKLTKQVEELEQLYQRLQDISDTFKEGSIPDTVNAVTTIDSVNELINEFDSLEQELKSGDKTSAEYCNKLIRMSEIILTLQKSLKTIRADDTLKELFVHESGTRGEGTMMGVLSSYATNKSKKIIGEITGDKLQDAFDTKISGIQEQIGFLSNPYTALNEKITEYLELRAKLNDEDLDLDEYSAIDDEVQDLERLILALDKTGEKAEAIRKVFADFDEEKINDKEIYGAMYNAFGLKDANQTGGKISTEAAERAAEEAQQRASEAEANALRYQETANRLLDEKNALQDENQKLQEQINQQSMSEEEMEVLRKENASLEEKLSLLRDISDEYANNITQRDRNTYEKLVDKEMDSGLTSKEEDRLSDLSDKIYEADAALEELGNTYDKIILKLANGKMVEILPDDKGLRSLYKFSDEGYGETYNGIDIEDVVFVRTQQEEIIQNNVEAIASYEELCQVVKRYNELVFKGSSRTSKESIELDAINQRFDATKGERTPEQAIDDSIAWGRMLGAMGDLDSNKLAKYLGIEIPQAASRAEDAISDAASSVKLFEKSDGQFGLFDDVVEGAQKADAEVEDLKDSIQQVSVLDGQIGFDDYLSHRDDSQKKTDIDVGADVVSGDTQSEVSQLETLQQKLLEVKAAVDAKTTAFEEEYVTVDAAVDAEIASLNKLKDLLVEIQGVLQTVFPASGMNLGGIELSQGKENVGTTSTAIQDIQQTLGQILAVLQSFTGLETDGKNSITHKEATAKAPANNANVIEPFTNKLNDLATEGTLSKIPAAIDGLADAIGNKTKAESDTNANTINALDTLISALNSNVKSLQDVMSGVVQYQKSQKSDTSAAMAKIASPEQYKQISDIAANSVGNLGSEVQIKGMKALADGIVKVEGAFKNAKDEWEGFTVSVNGSNQAVDLAVNKQSSFAKALNDTAEKARETAQEVKQVQDVPVEDPFTKTLANQKNTFNEYRKNLQNVDYLTDGLREELDGLGVSLQQVGNQSGLDAWIKRFNSLKENVQAVQSEFEQMNLGTINVFQRELSNSFNKLTLPQREDVLQEYLQAIVLLDKQKQAVKEGSAVEVSAIKDVTAELQKQIDAQIEANKAAKDAVNVQKKNGNFGSTASINATAKYNSLTGMASSKEFANSSIVTAALKQYKEAYESMMATRDRLRSKNIIDDSDKEEFKRLTTECNNAASALDKLLKSTMKLKGNKANPRDWMLGTDFEDNKEGRKQVLTDFVKSVYDIDVAAEDFKKDWNEVVFAIDNGNGTFTKMTATFTDARNEIVALAGDTDKVQSKFGSFVDGVKSRLQSLSQYFIATVGIYDVWNVVKQGVSYVREIDSALTELKKVTDETDASYDQFLQDMSKTGSVIGATVKDLTTMAAEWSRLGYSLSDSAQLAESTAVLLNVSEFDDATAASEALISTMQAFQYTADESGHVVDILNEVKFTCLRV